MKAYNYFIENLDNKKIEEIKDKIANIPLVKEVNIGGEGSRLTLEYKLGDNDDEYGVFVGVTEILQQEGADIAFVDEPNQTYVKSDTVEEQAIQDFEEIDECEIEDNFDTDQDKKPSKKGFFSKLPNFAVRLSEILFALLMFVFTDFSSYISAGICIVLVSYEVFYDAICDFSKKKITDNMLASLVIIFSCLCGHLLGAFIFGATYSLLKILIAFVVYKLKNKTEDFYAFKTLDTEDGEEIDVEELKVGLVLNVSNKIFFNCEIVKGNAEVKRANGEIVEVKEGENLFVGDIISKGETLTVKSLENYSQSLLKGKRENQKATSEQVNKINPNKKIRLFYTAVIIASLIYCFISPLFVSGDYLTNLSVQGIKGVLVLALFAPLVDGFGELRKELLRYFCIKQVNLTDFNLVEDLYNVKSAFYNQEVFKNGEDLHQDAYGMIREVKDLGVTSQTAFGTDEQSLNLTCDMLKLKNRVLVNQENCLETNGSLVVDKLNDKISASVCGTEIFNIKDNLRAIPKVYSASKRAKLLKKLTYILGGVAQGLIFVLTCISVLTFSSAVLLSVPLMDLVGVMNLLEIVEF